MHILDLVMYVILVIVIWNILGEEYTQELGGLVGLLVLFLFTIAYLVLFVWIDYNWIDIFRWLINNMKL